MGRRKVHWQVPKEWPQREERDVAAKMIDKRKAALMQLQDALAKGTLKAVSHI